MSKTAFPDLFQAIGIYNGGSASSETFYLPDLQGYFLRGVDETGKVDVGTNTRTTPTNQPAASLPGSVEGFATALPVTQLSALIPDISTDYHYTNPGDIGPLAYSMCAWNAGTSTFSVNTSSRPETVPVNMYMHYMIKVLPTSRIPVGSVIPFAGQASKGPSLFDGLWAKCEGIEADENASIFAKLYAVIGDRYGTSTDGSAFLLPDLQGRFIRGVDVHAGRDKNGNRLPPPGFPGNTDPLAGSTQVFANGPSANPWTCDIAHFFNGNHSHEVFEIAGHTNCRDTDWQNYVGWQGGDKETRPVNVSVQYFISMAETSTKSSSVDTIPVGAVIAIPGAGKPDTNFWVLCNGAEVSTTGAYAQLYEICGAIWGQPPGNTDVFNLPDMRGQFLRGVDNTKAGSTLIDPDRDNRTALMPGGATKGTGSKEGWATSATNVNMDISYPTRHWDNAAGATANQTAAWNPDTQAFPVKGGDAETRPINLAVYFYIKYATAQS